MVRRLCAIAAHLVRWLILEEIPNRHRQGSGDLLKSAGSDPIGALLVFLDLLQCHAKAVTELLLTEAEDQSAQSHSLADLKINQIELLGYFLVPSQTAPAYPMIQ